MVHPDDWEKKAFMTPWGMFMYARIPFGIMNAGTNFQQAMDIEFFKEKDKFIMIHLDDIIVYYNSVEQHLGNLKKFFQKFRKFDISLNPKKSHFGMQEGNCWGTSSRKKV